MDRAELAGSHSFLYSTDRFSGVSSLLTCFLQNENRIYTYFTKMLNHILSTFSQTEAKTSKYKKNKQTKKN